MKYESLWHRLTAQVRIEGDCWTWTGSVRRHGGGDRPAVSLRNRGEKHPVTGKQAHPTRHNACRLMCLLIHGEPPNDGQLWEASHLCEDNWLCCNPDHLLWETKKENMARRAERRRREALEIDYDTRGEITDTCPF